MSRKGISSGHPKSLWRNRDYLLLWSGQAISEIGGAVSELAFPLLFPGMTRPLGLALIGVLIQHLGVFPTIWLSWALLLVIIVIVTALPQVRR